MSVCLDSYAILAWLQNERGGDIVDEMLASAKQNPCFISVINLGEVYYRLFRLRGREDADQFWDEVRNGGMPLTVVEASRPRVQLAARLKAQYPIAYADSFAAQLAMEKDVKLVTGDPELKSLEVDGVLSIHWL